VIKDNTPVSISKAKEMPEVIGNKTQVSIQKAEDVKAHVIGKKTQVSTPKAEEVKAPVIPQKVKDEIKVLIFPLEQL